MGKFRYFMEATPAYLAGVHYSQPLGLPDTANVYQKPGEIPPGGLTNFSAIAQHQTGLARYRKIEQYQKTHTLHRLSALANYAVIAVLENDPARIKSGQKRYRVMYLDPAPHIVPNPNDPTKQTLVPGSVKFIRGIPYQGFVSSGGYPELRHTDLEIGQKLNIIIDDQMPIDPKILATAGLQGEKLYAIDVDALRQAMLDSMKASHEDERKYKAWNYLGGQVDKMFGHMASGTGGQQVMQANNPLSGN